MTAAMLVEACGSKAEATRRSTLRHRISVVAQRCCSASAVPEACRGVTQVKPGREELAGGVGPQFLDVELDTRRSRQVADLMRGPVGIPWRAMHRVVGEQVGIRGQLMADSGEGSPAYSQDS
jgi:hypothetical protein